MADISSLTLTEKAVSMVRNPIQNADTLPSPALVFYKDGIEKNIDAAVRTAGSASRLRPHIKTHKNAEIVRMAMDRGIMKFKCATIAEAEMLAQTGVRDVVIAYPLVGRNAERLTELAEKFPDTRFSVLTDSLSSVRWLENCAEKQIRKQDRNSQYPLSIGIFFDIDVGQHRTGITRLEDAEAIGSYLSSCRFLYSAGLHCYDGHNRQQNFDERMAAARESIEIMESFRRLLESRGTALPEIIMGGTPTFPCYAAADDERFTLSPGTFFLFDFRYSALFPDLPFTPAAVIIAHVISRNTERKTFTIDLGSKGISTDQKDIRGIILNVEGCRPILQSEEHWVFSADSGNLPEIGKEIYVMPAHICTTVHHYGRAYIARKSRKSSSGSVFQDNKDSQHDSRDASYSWYTTWKIAARDRVLTV